MKVLKSRLAIGLAAIAIAVFGFAVFGAVFTQDQVEARPRDWQVSSSNVYRFADGSVVEGAAANLIRTRDGITATVDTSTLEEDHAYTLWWVIFNRPHNCEYAVEGLTNCGEGDVFAQPLGDSPVKVSVQYAAGNIVGGTGVATFGAHLEERYIPSADGQLVFGPGLYNSYRAEVHLVIRDHGKAIDDYDMEMAQIKTFGGACTPETDPSGVGPAGPNDCADVQFAVFMPDVR